MSAGQRVQWDEDNLAYNDENKGDYEKIIEAATPYMPPLDMSTIPDEDDDGFGEDGAGHEMKEEEEDYEQRRAREEAFNAALQARLEQEMETESQAVAAAREENVRGGEEDEEQQEEEEEDVEMERSDDYRDGLAFEAKRLNHYNMRDALRLGRQMIDDEDEEDDSDDDYGPNIAKEMAKVEKG